MKGTAMSKILLPSLLTVAGVPEAVYSAMWLATPGLMTAVLHVGQATVTVPPREGVAPPLIGAVVLIVMLELARKAFVAVPVSPSVTLPAEPFVNVGVMPLNALPVWKFIGV